MRKIVSILLATAFVLPAAACSKGDPEMTNEQPKPDATPVYKCEGTAENLRGFFEELGATIRAGDSAKAAALTKIVLPDRDRLARGLKDDPGDALDKAWGAIAKHMPGTDAETARALASEPARTLVRVHGATTEEIAAYEEGGVAFREFPGGARGLAQQGILRPGLTFYEVELLEPGKDSGMKYHLFFFDGERWTMMGPIWRGF